MTFLSPNLSLTLTQQRPTCVLDPSLVLSPYGLPLARHLGRVMELWVARELWHVLDNTYFYEHNPESIMMTDPRTLQDWKWAKTETNPASLNLFWLGDRPGESFLPPHNTDPHLFERWEFVIRSLDEHINRQDFPNSFLTSALRDTLALTIALDCASILTYQSPENAAANFSPLICTVLENWNIPCQAIALTDPLATLESKNFLYLFVQAGLSKLLWSGLNLAILHLFVPATSALYYGTRHLQDSFYPKRDRELDSSNPNLWEGARGFWYWI
jgi:hypothetical protein